MAAPDIKGALFLIDGNSLAYRAFYALPETIATSDGFPTNALYGFTTMLIKILTDYEPSSVIVAWDAGKKVFRHEQYEEYKAGRKPMPDPLAQQMGEMDELVQAFGFKTLKKEGYEADDILATLAREAREHKQKTVIVTADRDALQLVDDETFVMSNTKGVSDVKVYDSEAVRERYGVPPDKVPDFIGLKGDTSDNIPGVPGIGDKTAAALLSEHATLEQLLEHLAEVKGKRRQLLEEYADQALFSKELATMYDEVPLEGIETIAEPADRDSSRLREAMEHFEFNTITRRLEELGLLEAPRGQANRLVVETASIKNLKTALKGKERVALVCRDDGDKIDAAFLVPGDEVTGNGFDGCVLLFAMITPGQLEESLEGLGIVTHDSKALLKLAPGLIAENGHDTMIAAYLLRPSARSYSLEQLAATAGLHIDVETDRTGELDLSTSAAQAWGVAASQEGELESLDLTRLFQEVEMPLVRVLADMEAAGIRVDLARLGELAAKVADQLDQLADRIYEEAGEQFNIDSPKQLSVVLFEKLKLPPGRRTKTGYSTDASVLKGLRSKHPIIEMVEEYRELAKLNNTYIQSLPGLADEHTWRLHTTFNQTVTATGRLSSSDPNLQNIPVRTPLGEKIRDCFVADEEKQLVTADYSQVELRILANLSDEQGLKQAFSNGEDIHRATAAEVFGVGPDEVTSTQRGRAKAVNFGIIYGISAFGLSEQLGIPQGEAGGYIDAYLKRYARVAEFRREIIERATADGYVTTVLGRRRNVPELRSHDERVRRLGERLAVNTVIQGSAADIIKVAMIAIHEKLQQLDKVSRMVLQVHDELVFEAPGKEVEQVSELARAEMVAAWEMDPPLAVDVGHGSTWLEAKA